MAGRNRSRELAVLAHSAIAIPADPVSNGEKRSDGPRGRHWAPLRPAIVRFRSALAHGIGAKTERAIELVQGRQPPPEICGRSKGERFRCSPGKARSPGRLPAASVGKSNFGKRPPASRWPFPQMAVRDRPTVDSATRRRSEETAFPRRLGEAARGASFASRRSAPGRKARDEREQLVGTTDRLAKIRAQSQLEGTEGRAQLDACTKPGGGDRIDRAS